MGLLSSLLLRPGPHGGAAAEPDTADSVTQARVRARQRLIGAVVLVGIGVIAFPLLFETQPRPIPVDVAIDIPKRDGAAPLAVPPPRPAERGASTGAAATPTGPAAAPRSEAAAPSRTPSTAEVITETAAEAGLATAAPPARVAAASAPRPAVAAAPRPEARAPEPRPEPRVEARVEPRPEPKPQPRPEPKPSADDGARARALLDGKPSAAAATPAAATAGSARYIVQIGAFADANLAQQTRQKVERLGLTTYTHVAQTPDGARTRVRVGPVNNRQDAEKMAARIKAAGLPAAILTL